MSAVAAGDQLEGFALAAITQAEVDAYVRASGDDNPLHHDIELARRAGLAGIPVPGMLIMAQLARCARNWPRCAELTKISARFVSPVLVGDGLEVGGRVVATGEGYAIVRLIARHGGKIAVLGEARVRVSVG